MDKRWKAAERGIAYAINRALSGAGNYSKIDRIPLLGREGPDLTINELGLVINVKSRKTIPERLFPMSFEMISIGDLVCFRVEDLRFARLFRATRWDEPWKQLTDWYELMESWTKEQGKRNLKSCIIIHRPRMPYGHAGVVIHKKHLKRLK